MSNIPRSDADTYANLKLATAAGENELNFGYLRMLFEYLIFFTIFSVSAPSAGRIGRQMMANLIAKMHDAFLHHLILISAIT